MLLNLYVKNLALIEEADIAFGQGLNILTGETGAGKSILIGSVNIALGQKAPKDIIRTGKEFAYIELIFSVKDREKIKTLKKLDVFPDEDGQIIISRKIMPSRSISKINDETVTTAKVRQITSLFLDIHGQHEHQSLLYKSKHLEILDEYANPRIGKLKMEISALYQDYREIIRQLEACQVDEESRIRQMDFLRFEIDEIEHANLNEGEEEELHDHYRKFRNSKKIAEGAAMVYEEIAGDHNSSSERLGRALKEFHGILEYDSGLMEIYRQMADAEAVLSEASRELSGYIEELTFDEEEFYEMEKRLDFIHNLQAKYGGTWEKIQDALSEKKQQLEELENMAIRKVELTTAADESKAVLLVKSESLSAIRKKAALELSAKIKKALLDLNFLDVEFSIEFHRLEDFGRLGIDEAEFMISMNPGERLKPLGQVASGGELSRIMLAMKSVLADQDQIPTLIFDEIDTGISGRTAQKVSEKLAGIGRHRQVICITHLPQIAAMADFHFAIEKQVENHQTVTRIRKLLPAETVGELARLLGGAEITQTVLEHAAEMKDLAERTKEN